MSGDGKVRVYFDVTEAQLAAMKQHSVYLDVFGSVRLTDTADCLIDPRTGYPVPWRTRAV